MKKYIIVFVILAIVGIALIIPGNNSVGSDIYIDRSPEATYSYLMNLQNWSEWIGEANSEYDFDGLPGVVGATLSWQHKKLNKVVLVHLKEPQFIQFLFETFGDEPSLQYFYIDKEAGGTRLQWMIQKSNHNPIEKLATWMEGPTHKKRIEVKLSRLKKAIDQAPSF